MYGGESTVGHSSSPPAPLSTHLHLAALDQHMTTLPAQSTAAYFRAITKCPDEDSNERKLLFLQCEENSVPLAAQRLALYWQYRLDRFGEDRCFEPMTLAGAMKNEIINMATSGIYQLMPNTDAAERAIIFCRTARRDLSQYSVRQEFMWLTYLLEIVVQHRSLQGRGFLLLMDTSNATRKHYTSQGLSYLQRALDAAFPIRQRSIHVCNAGPLVNYVLYPVVMRVISKSMRLRTRLHRGSGDDLLRSLAEFNLPQNRVPSDMGGSVLLDISQFLIDRLSFEASHAGIDLQPVEDQGQSNLAFTTLPSASNLSSASPNYNNYGQAPPVNIPSAGGVHLGGTNANSNVFTVDADKEATSNSTTTIAANSTCDVGGRHLPLSNPSDKTYLSPLVCLIRAQIEIFSATEADMQARAALGGIVQAITPGRVGIRCIHCWDRPPKERANGAVSYPASIRVLNQGVRNWQRYHWKICPFIPPSTREEFERLNSGKKTYSSKKSKEYWIHWCEEMGLVDASLDTGIHSEGLALGPLVFPEEKTSGAIRKKVKEGTMKSGTSGSDDSKKMNVADKSPDDEDVASILLHFKQSG